MVMRLAVLGDIHGNVGALEAALADIKRHKPDRLVITGDLTFNGPRPAETIERVRALEKDGALVIAGNTDIAVADADYAAAFPWLDDVPATHRAAAEWAHDQLSDEQLDYLRRLPSERRLWVDGLLVLACHASPGSMTAGLPADLDPTTTVERVTRSDARVIACGHTHVADVRELGRKLILNPGSCGYAFDGDPAACWALLTMPDDDDAQPSAELFRPAYDAAAAAEEVAGRGLSGDVYRAATIRTGRLIR
ncbi:MAG TPA: metallophosphoesterase family protein [Candidatus Limnocylindrales bacterium]|nr:metallophosphoesterase family protein [Candidatus Limnocylindrales bacterium]